MINFGVLRARRKTLLLVGITLILLLIAGLFTRSMPWQHTEPKVKVTLRDHSGSLPDGFYLYQHLNEQGITIKSITSDEKGMVISFNSSEESHAAEQALRQLLDDSYTIN